MTLIEHAGGRPAIDGSAYVASTAVISGDVSVGPGSRVLHGAVLTADGGPVSVGAACVVVENAVLRGTRRHPLRIGDHVLVGPRAYLSGCTIEEESLASMLTILPRRRLMSPTMSP